MARPILVHTCITPEEDEGQFLAACGCDQRITRAAAGRLVASGSAQWRQWRSRLTGALVEDYRAVTIASPRCWKPRPSDGVVVLQLVPVGS